MRMRWQSGMPNQYVMEPHKGFSAIVTKTEGGAWIGTVEFPDKSTTSKTGRRMNARLAKDECEKIIDEALSGWVDENAVQIHWQKWQRRAVGTFRFADHNWTIVIQNQKEHDVIEVMADGVIKDVTSFIAGAHKAMDLQETALSLTHKTIVGMAAAGEIVIDKTPRLINVDSREPPSPPNPYARNPSWGAF